MAIIDHPKKTSGYTPHDEMIEAIIEIIKIQGECCTDDLKLKGFSPEEILRHWAMSYALAKVQLNWMD
jgi:hypothetical protein